MIPRFGVYRPKFKEWWCGGRRWSRTEAPARWFESVDAAENAALRELPDPRTDWTIEPISLAGSGSPEDGQ